MTHHLEGISRILIVVCLSLLVSACASQPTTLSDPERDPWEGFNRKVHAFNMGVDKAILRPVARGYDKIMPDAPQRGVRNFFNNLRWPVDFVNLLLQGRVRDSISETGRFLLNTTIGLGGFFDIASRGGHPNYDEDFGQTLAVWGWKNSNYLVVPFLGPQTVRDTLGRSFYGYLHPVNYYIREESNYVPLVVDLITLRAQLLPFDEEIQAAADPYILIRDVSLQRREYDIYNGNPPVPDYDALLEDFD